MPNFITALKKGIKAHEQAEENIANIQNVLNTASNQFSAAGINNFKFLVKKSKRKSNALMMAQIAATAASFTAAPALESFYEQQRIKKAQDMERPYDALHATIENHEVELAEWSQADTGFPVKIRYSGYEVSCRDTTALERELENLLSGAHAGGAIRKLLSDASAELPSTPDPIISEWEEI